MTKAFFRPKVGALILDKETDVLRNVTTYFNKSIHTFRTDFSELSTEAKLVCCFVYTALAICIDRTYMSIVHQEAAYNLIQDYEKQVSNGDLPASPTISKFLSPLMKRLLVDAITYSDAMKNTNIDPYTAWSKELLSLPNLFDDVETAYENMGMILMYAIAISRGLIQPDSRAATRMDAALILIEAILSTHPPNVYNGNVLDETATEFHKLDLLVHACSARILATCRTNEHSYETRAVDFEFIVQSMKYLMQIEPLNPRRVTLGWIAPLFLVATKCRNSDLRQEALTNLHKLTRIEQGWTSCVAHVIAKHCVYMETEVEQNHISAGIVQRTFLRLQSINLIPHCSLAIITFEKQVGKDHGTTYTTSLPLKTTADFQRGIPAQQIPNAVLQACGYNSTALFCPQITCNCMRSIEFEK